MTDPTKKNQKDQILEHIEKYGSITPLEAQRLYGCMRLGARIWDLRKDGYEIVRESSRGAVSDGGVGGRIPRLRSE